MSSRTRRLLAGVAGALLTLQPATAHAGGWPGRDLVRLDSDADVQCLAGTTGACRQLQFGLEVAGDDRLFGMAVLNRRPDQWRFTGVSDATSDSYRAVLSVGAILGFFPGHWVAAALEELGLALEPEWQVAFAAGTTLVPDPFHLSVSLGDASAGTAAELLDGSFHLVAAGRVGDKGKRYFYTTSSLQAQPLADPLAPATVNPEPATLLLLGTGLAGLAAARRRRRTAAEP